MKKNANWVFWGLVLASIWLLLSQGDIASWVIGLPFILIAMALRPSGQQSQNKESTFNLTGLLRFSYFFFIESFRGAIDISRRVLATDLKIDPYFYEYSIRLRHPVARQLFVNTISLVPGTLSADWFNENARIHSLDKQPQLKQGVIQLENRIASIFGEQLDGH